MGYVTMFLNSADKGKTLGMIATALHLHLNEGYAGDDIHGNLEFHIPGYHQYDNAGIREVMRNFVKNRERHKIIMVDEVDTVFPARFFSKAEQTQTLLGLWQYTKMDSHWLGTTHLGNSTDAIIDSTVQISCIPEYDKLTDTLTIEVINGIDLDFGTLEIPEASRLFPIYNRFQPIL